MLKSGEVLAGKSFTCAWKMLKMIRLVESPLEMGTLEREFGLE
jgi:hypothetical protein